MQEGRIYHLDTNYEYYNAYAIYSDDILAYDFPTNGPSTSWYYEPQDYPAVYDPVCLTEGEFLVMVEYPPTDGYLQPDGIWLLIVTTEETDQTIDTDEDGTLYLNLVGIGNPPAAIYEDQTLSLTNNQAYDLPTSGAVGITTILAIGAMIILIGLIDMAHKKKRKISSLRASVYDARRIITNYDKIKTHKSDITGKHKKRKK